MSPLDHLLQAAAKSPAEPAAEMPFGFNTRVLATLRATAHDDAREFTSLIRRALAVSAALMFVATGFAYPALRQAAELREPSTNAYAVADSAIQDELER